jgi:hypothetical protein
MMLNSLINVVMRLRTAHLLVVALLLIPLASISAAPEIVLVAQKVEHEIKEPPI